METFDEGRAEALKLAVEEVVLDWQAVTTPWMFGYPAYKARETIFAMVVNDGLVLTRLPDVERERLAESYEIGPFEAGGQTIDSWVHVRVGADDLDDLVSFVRASHEAALGESRNVPPPEEDA